jgi:uncharacterized protein (DUF1800 family)
MPMDAHFDLYLETAAALPESVASTDPDLVTSGLEKYKGPWGEDQLRHLLRRTQFGVSPPMMAQFHKKKMKKVVKALLDDKEDMPAPPVNQYNDDKFTDPDVPVGETWVLATKYDGMNNYRRKGSYKDWWLSQMLHQGPTIKEKMVLFWHNHFATETNTIDNARFCYQYNVTLRRYALGNFKEMVKAITLEPAMLRYLNGYVNTKKAPDENYGRELQELFTMGKGPGSHYTEGDVKAAAHVLTGYKIDYKTFTSHFDPKSHDETDKTFSDFYNGKVIQGRQGPDGEQELDEMLDMIFAQQEVSRFICRKLYRFYVYHDIDERTERDVITPLAETFRSHHYDIQPVLKELFSSAHFYDQANRGSQIKSPLDITVGLCREFQIELPADTDLDTQYKFWQQMRNQAASMSQNIGDPPNVAGWQAYYQTPEFDKLWISSDTLPKRNQLTDRMVANGFNNKNGAKAAIDVVAFTGTFAHPEDPNAVVDEATARLLAIEVSPETKAFLKTDILLSGLSSDHYWTGAWQGLKDNPEDQGNKKIVTGKLKAFYKYLMNMPEYQLC